MRINWTQNDEKRLPGNKVVIFGDSKDLFSYDNIVNDTVDNSQSENKVHTNTIVKPGTNTTDKTTSGESELPQTGESDMIIKLLVLSALLIIVNKMQIQFKLQLYKYIYIKIKNTYMNIKKQKLIINQRLVVVHTLHILNAKRKEKNFYHVFLNLVKNAHR